MRRLVDMLSLDRDSRSLCLRCRQVDFEQLFIQVTPVIALLSVSGLRSRSSHCSFCRLLLGALDTAYDGVCPQGGYVVVLACPSLVLESTLESPRKFNRLWVRWQEGTIKKTVRVDMQLSPEGYMMYRHESKLAVQVLAPSTASRDDAILYGRRLPPSQVDPSLLKSWINTCEGVHQGSCAPVTLPQQDFGMRVIDVKRRCVVEAPPRCRYVALSYVWGKSPQLLLTEGTKARLLHNDNALRDGDKSIPLTIRDAIYVCELLGEPYLWIDALCIQQDSAADGLRQLNKMEIIYQGAKLTIVAASGDSTASGLPGLRSGTRDNIEHIASIRTIQLASTPPQFKQSVMDSVWHQRGWTCQEKHLSARLLIFTKHQTFFKCQVGDYSEDVHSETNDSNRRVLRLEALGPLEAFAARPVEFQALTRYKLPFERYNQLLRDYSHRQLGYDSDALNAFTGILNTLKYAFTFFWGLPRERFLDALFWRSRDGAMSLRRGTFPSWSWAGWKFAVDRPYTDVTGDFIPILPCTVFYRVGRAGQALPIDEDDTLQCIRDLYVRRHGSTEEYLEDKAFCGPNPEFRKELEAPWEWYNDLPVFPPPLALEELARLKPLRPQLLRFYTWAVRIPVGRNPIRKSANADFLWVGRLGTAVWLDPAWRAQQPEDLDFLALAHVQEPTERSVLHYFLMLVEYKDDVAYRVQMAEEPGNGEELFEKFKPEWKLITMG